MATAATLVFAAAHHVVVCRSCGSCIAPGQASLGRRWCFEPHDLVGGLLKSINLNSPPKERASFGLEGAMGVEVVGRGGGAGACSDGRPEQPLTPHIQPVQARAP